MNYTLDVRLSRYLYPNVFFYFRIFEMLMMMMNLTLVCSKESEKGVEWCSSGIGFGSSSFSNIH